MNLTSAIGTTQASDALGKWLLIFVTIADPTPAMRRRHPYTLSTPLEDVMTTAPCASTHGGPGSRGIVASGRS
jgi:hypothetical protein